MSFGCMLIVGWLFGRAADFFCGLPPLLGYMAFGFIFATIQGPILQASRRYMLTIAFIVVLVRAGLEISPKDLTAFTVALSMLPFAADALVAGITAQSIYGLTSLEAATYSSIMCSLGEGIIIPRMVDMVRRAAPGHTLLPRSVLTASPVECIIALFMYGACASMLNGVPKEGDTSGTIGLGPGLQAARLLLQVIVTLAVAALIANAFALLLGARKRIVWKKSGKRLFIGSAHEELLVVIAMAMVAYGVSYVIPVPQSLASRQPDPNAATYGSTHGRMLAGGSGGFEPLVEADLSVVTTIFIFARLRPRHTVHRVEEGIAGIWTVGAIFLFVSLGSNLKLPAQSRLVPSNPLALLAPVAAGLVARLGALCALMAATTRARGLTLNARNLFFETGFVFAGTLPRATIQGVLGRLPQQNGIVSPELGELYAASASITVLLFAPLGVILQSLLCERCLSRTDMPPAPPGVGVAQHGVPAAEPAADNASAIARALALPFSANYLTTADGVALDGVDIGSTDEHTHGKHAYDSVSSEERAVMDGPALVGAYGEAVGFAPPTDAATATRDARVSAPFAGVLSRQRSRSAALSERRGTGPAIAELDEEKGRERAESEEELLHAQDAAEASARVAATRSRGANEPLSEAEDLELQRISTLYTHAPVLPVISPSASSAVSRDGGVGGGRV